MKTTIQRRGLLLSALMSVIVMGAGVSDAQQLPRKEGQSAPLPRTKPRPDLRPAPSPLLQPGAAQDTTLPDEFRRIDGRDNNLDHPEWGSATRPLLRLVRTDYADGSDSPSGPARPSTREVSNALCAQSESIPNRRGATDYLWQWGQFVDHDIDETPAADPAEPFNIPVPPGDPWFDPDGTGTKEIPLNRSFGEEHDGVRQQVNEITSYIDASNVYGATEERAFALRTLDGTGRLKVTVTENGDLLPYNLTGLSNAPADSPNFFLAGDVRANEQVALTAMHTLFVREHNHWASKHALLNPGASGEELYQFARLIVSAEMQAITYREFLPVLLGADAIRPYEGYRPEVQADISNVFATAAYRLGHSMLSTTLLRLDASGNEIAAGHLPLASAFFAPAEIENNGIDSVLRGLAAQTCQELDENIVDDVRNFLFGPPGSGGFDLAALNMQRGRDHGLPSFNGTCRSLGLRPARRFADINPDPAVAGQLGSVYDRVEQVDCWIGGLCEPHLEGAMVGPMLQRILVDQFTRLRDGDRFWYQNHLPPELVKLVEEQSLARIIRRNTEIGPELPGKVFLRSGSKLQPKAPNRLQMLTPTRLTTGSDVRRKTR